MDEKSREEIVAALERAIALAGAKDYESGIEQAEKLLRFGLDGIERIRTRDALRKTLDASDQMSKHEQKLFLVFVKLLPQIFRLGLKKAAKDAERNLPALPGGRPRAATGNETKTIIDFVAKLHRAGVEFKVAKKRASMKFDVGLRTIERLWSKRATIEEYEPTVQDVITSISTGKVPSQSPDADSAG